MAAAEPGSNRPRGVLASQLLRYYRTRGNSDANTSKGEWPFMGPMKGSLGILKQARVKRAGKRRLVVPVARHEQVVRRLRQRLVHKRHLLRGQRRECRLGRDNTKDPDHFIQKIKQAGIGIIGHREKGEGWGAWSTIKKSACVCWLGVGKAKMRRLGCRNFHGAKNCGETTSSVTAQSQHTVTAHSHSTQSQSQPG